MPYYNDEISQYITGLFAHTDEAQQRALEESPKRGLPAISVKPEEGRFLQVLTRLSGGQKALEIGTLGGFSGIWIARGLAPGGKLITLEKEPRHAEVAREHFELAGLADRVEIRVGDAHELIQTLGPEGPFDFVFVDAEKTGYPNYFRWALENVRIGGAIAMHNAFRAGKIIEAHNSDPDIQVMRQVNKMVSEEPRVLSIILPSGDGTLIAVRIA